MMTLQPRTLIAIGFILVLLGFIFPWLMVLRIIEPTFFLGFFSYGATVSGLFLGMIGAITYVREYRRKNRDR
jgi:positive regulator of sigma E activity